MMWTNSRKESFWTADNRCVAGGEGSGGGLPQREDGVLQEEAGRGDGGDAQEDPGAPGSHRQGQQPYFHSVYFKGTGSHEIDFKHLRDSSDIIRMAGIMRSGESVLGLTDPNLLLCARFWIRILPVPVLVLFSSIKFNDFTVYQSSIYKN